MPRNASGAASARHPFTRSLPMPGSTSTGTARRRSSAKDSAKKSGVGGTSSAVRMPGRDAGVEQAGGDPVDARVELGVGHRAEAAQRRQRQRGAVGVRPRALGEQPVERAAAHWDGGHAGASSRVAIGTMRSAASSST